MIHDDKHKIPTKSSHHFLYRLGWYFMLINSRNNRESQETSALQHRALPKARVMKPVTTQCFDWLKNEQWQDSALGRPRTYLTCLQTKSPQYMTILEHTGGQCSFVTQEDAHILYAYSKYVYFSILSNTHTHTALCALTKQSKPRLKKCIYCTCLLLTPSFLPSLVTTRQGQWISHVKPLTKY